MLGNNMRVIANVYMKKCIFEMVYIANIIIKSHQNVNMRSACSNK